jgi:hypothetical protein
MIRGPNYVFLNIPHTGAEQIEDLLFKRCKGQVVTPTHETLMEIVDKKTKVFTLVRKPFHRAMEIAETYGRGEKPIEYLTWLKTRDTLFSKLYSYWLDHCTNLFKVEEVHEKLSPFLLSLGYKVTVPEINTQTFETTIEEAEFIKKAFKDDFIQALYSTDRRSNT